MNRLIVKAPFFLFPFERIIDPNDYVPNKQGFQKIFHDLIFLLDFFQTEKEMQNQLG